MSPQPARKSRLAWIPWSLIALVFFAGNVAGNLIATDLDQKLKPYRIWVWLVFAVAGIIAVVEYLRSRRLELVDENPTEFSERNISVGGDAAGSAIISGDRNTFIDQSSGDYVAGDKIVYQSSAPAPNPLHQLPPPTPDFTGRENELAELRRHLHSGVAIFGAQGMGGVGKTALALRLADELKPNYPDAQFYLDLKGVSPEPLSPMRAMEHVIRAYHPEAKLPDDEHQIAALFRSALEGKRALLLWDNASDASQVAPLRPPAGCLMLVTSRNHFAIPGLHSVDLDSMRPEEARALLLRIEPRIGDAAARMAELCGHLPLALELAANGLKVRKGLSPSDYIGRLEQAERRIAALDRTDAERKLASTLESSYALLDDGRRRLWRALAVFPGGFDHRATAALWETDAEEARDALDDLAALSLVVFDPAKSRYRLHDLLRVFADARLRESESERDALRLKHAAHYKDLLVLAGEQYLAGGAKLAAGLSLYDQDRSNIEAGQAWAAARIRQDRQAAQLAAEYVGAGEPVLDLRQHPRERIAWLNAGVRACREIGDRRGEGNALGNLGMPYTNLGEVRKAIEYYEQALVIDSEIGNRSREGADLGNLGNAYAVLGEVRKAIEYYEQALVIDREIGDRRGEGNVLGNLGLAYAALGEVRKAIEYYEQALVIDREIGDRRGEGTALGNLGNACADLGEVRKAIEYYEQQIEIARGIGDRREEGNALGNLGNAYADLGEVRKAIEYHEQALVIDREIGDRRGEGADLGNLGNAYAFLGEVRKAIEYYEQHLEIAREIGDRRGEGAALGNLGLAYADLGEVRKAIEYYEQRIKIAREIGDRRGEANALYNWGNALAQLGEGDRAIEMIEAALAIYEQIESPNAEMARETLAELKGE